MQQIEQVMEQSGTERKRVEAVVETLANLRNEGESLAEVAHDARNMVTALGLYCELLQEPGVLATSFQHYGNELKLVAAASRRLVEKLVALDSQEARNSYPFADAARPTEHLAWHRTTGLLPRPDERWAMMPAEPVDNLAAELLACRTLLDALAGPSVILTVDAERGERPVRMTREDLTRILVNLVKNAAEAMPMGGRIQIGLRESPTLPGAPPSLILTIEDNGPGISHHALGRVFEPSYSTRSTACRVKSSNGWQGSHRGLGLSITRSIVEAAGGQIRVSNRDPSGACFQIELPVWLR
ncbi:MAG TPA: sensor histidine kinase [Terracidiphilus sp.]|nr:sensor histidine kinase [Terracidiphilus sp.]